MKNPEISIAFIFLILFVACNKDKEFDNLQDYERTNSTNVGDIGFKVNNDCDAYEDFEEEFCYRTLLPNIPESTFISQTSNFSDPEFYKGKTIELLVNGKLIVATPVLNPENEIDFYLEMDEGTYVLTKSNDVVINSKAIMGQVPAYLNSLYLVKDVYLSESIEIESLEELIGNAGSLVMDEDEKSLVVTIENEMLLPKDGGNDLKIIFGCDWERAITINKYLSRIGWPNHDLLLYPYYVEAALEGCEWECHYCTNPLCVFDGIREIGTFTYDELEQLDNALLKYGLALGDGEVARIGETQNIEIKDNLISLMSGEDYCRKHEVGNEVVNLLEEGIMQDVCNPFSVSQQDMILSVLENADFQHLDVEAFYISLSENFDYVIESESYKSNAKIKCIWDLLNDSSTELFCTTLDNFFSSPEYDLYFFVGNSPGRCAITRDNPSASIKPVST